MLSRIFSSYTGKHSAKKDRNVTLVVKDGAEGPETSIQIGRGLLTEHSGVFREAQKLKRGSKILLQDVTPVAMHKIVEYMKNSSATFLTHSEALETLIAADKYRIDGMSKICVHNLITILDPSNACDIYEIALSTSQGQLEYHCLQLIDKEAESVLGSRGFATLRKTTALAILKRTSLQVSSELAVFRAVLGWGLNACLRQGGDPNDSERFLPFVRYLFNYVRFNAMSGEELRDPEVSKYQSLMTGFQENGPFQATDPVRDRSMSTASHTSSSSTPDLHPRHYTSRYIHSLGLQESPHHQLKTGETFTLTLESLKGKVFLTRIRLAFKPFAATKRAACLYVSVTARNTSSGEQRPARGTFSGVEEDASLVFADPLVAGEGDHMVVSLVVKRAENMCVFVVRSDVQIAMPESKAVALKLTSSATSEAGMEERCILKELEYFF